MVVKSVVKIRKRMLKDDPAIADKTATNKKDTFTTTTRVKTSFILMYRLIWLNILTELAKSK